MLLFSPAPGGGQQQNWHVLCSSSKRSMCQAVESNMCGCSQTSKPDHDWRVGLAEGPFSSHSVFFQIEKLVAFFEPFDHHHGSDSHQQVGDPDQPMPVCHPV